MGSFVKVNRNPGKTNSYQYGPNQGSTQEMVYLQFIPGHVTEVITGTDSESWSDDERHLNSIKALPHFGIDSASTNLESIKAKLYVPLFRGIHDVPTQGDPVLLCNFGGIDYYLGPINTLNNPNFNPDHLKKLDSSDKSNANIGIKEALGINPYFKWRTGVKRLQKPFIKKLDSDDKEKIFGIGDLMLEGRHGNSIRIGSRSGYPNMIFSNGRNDTNTVETLMDGGLISLTTKGKITELFQGNFILGSSHEDLENSRQLEFEDIDDSQILLTSNRIILNARKNDIFMSSYGNINIGSGDQVRIYNKGATTIESSNIYLGEAATGEEQPLVLGTTLQEILEDLVDAIGLLFVGGTVGGVSMPVNLSGSPGWTAIDQIIKPKIKKMLSEYHYIEENGTK